MRTITMQPIPVLSDGGSHTGRLVFADANLVAVLVRVSDDETAGDDTPSGGWFLEAGFGPCSNLMTADQPVFFSLDDAVEWVRGRLDSGLSSS